MKHYSVMLTESIDGLNIKEDGVYIDGTLGYAGHSSEILKKLTTGHLYSFDQDAEAIEYANEKLSKIGENFTISTPFAFASSIILFFILIALL
mgnify:CR=1 FL=1